MSATVSMVLLASGAMSTPDPGPTRAMDSRPATTATSTASAERTREHRGRARLVLAILPGADAEEHADALASMRSHMAGAPVVPIVVDADDAPRSVREQFVWARQLAASHDALGVLWVDLAPDRTLVLYLVEAGGTQVLARELPRRDAGTLVTLEELGIVVHSIGTGLAEGEVIGMVPRDDLSLDPGVAPAPPPEPPRPTETRARPRHDPPGRTHLRISAAYGGTTYAPEIPWSSGFEVATRGAPRPWLYLGAAYRLALPRRVDHPAVTLSLTRHQPTLLLGVSGTLGARIRLDAEVLAAPEIVVRRTEATANARTTRDTPRVLGTVGARLRTSVQLAGGLSLVASVGLEGALRRFDLVAQRGAETQRLVQPAPVRAMVTAGVSYSFFFYPRRRPPPTHHPSDTPRRRRAARV